MYLCAFYHSGCQSRKINIIVVVVIVILRDLNVSRLNVSTPDPEDNIRKFSMRAPLLTKVDQSGPTPLLKDSLEVRIASALITSTKEVDLLASTIVNHSLPKGVSRSC